MRDDERGRTLDVHEYHLPGGWEVLAGAGVRFSTACPMQLFDNDVSGEDAIITNSNKLRTYTHARFFPDREIAEILVTGRMERDGWG